MFQDRKKGVVEADLRLGCFRSFSGLWTGGLCADAVLRGAAGLARADDRVGLEFDQARCQSDEWFQPCQAGMARHLADVANSHSNVVDVLFPWRVRFERV